MIETRTRDLALAELIKLLPEIQGTIPDERVRALLTEKVVTEMFEAAWKYQFMDDRDVAIATFRALVREALEGLTQE